MRVGFAGVGRMGANMARRAKDRGHDVTAVFDVDAGRARELADELGSRACAALAEVTAASDVVLTVVTDDAAMERLYATDGDSLLTGAAGHVFVDCATVSPAVHARVAPRIRAAGAEKIEACMASSIPQARAGTLFLIAGGGRDAFARVRPLLDDLAADVRYVGDEPGRAAQVKALVNMLMNVNTAALAEALALGDALGVDLTVLREVFGRTGAASRVLETDGEDMQNREHEVYFSAAHAAKDSGIALALAQDAGLRLPLATATAAQYDRMVREGLGELDKSGIAELTFRGRGPAARP